MSTPGTPPLAKLVCSIIAREPRDITSALERMQELFGPVDFLSEVMDFSHTDYYFEEMGSPLIRRVASFAGPVDPGGLPGFKLETNRLEAELSHEGKRRVNIDPGLLSPERLVLATGKSYTHRVYLGRGIWADLTLIYDQGGFVPLKWTYPDYRERPMREIYKTLRAILLRQLRCQT